MWHQQSYIPISAAYLTYASKTITDITTIFHASLNSRFIETNSNLIKRKIIELIKYPNFLETVLVIQGVSKKPSHVISKVRRVFK